jgi:hypothetical protein
MRESKMFDVKEVLLTQQTIDVDAQGMSSQFGVQTGTQTPKGVSMVGLNVELSNELTIHRFDYLPNAGDALGHHPWQLAVLIGSGHAHQADAIAFQQSIGYRLADVPFVSHSVQISVLLQQFITRLQVSHIGRGKFKVYDHPSQRDEELHLVAEEGLLFGRNPTKGGSIGKPVPTSLRSQVKVHHRNRQTVNATLPVLGYVQHSQHHSSDQIESTPKPSSASVEAALRRDVREQITMSIPLREEGQLRVPPFAFTNQTHSHQLLVRAARGRAWSREQMANLSVGIFHDAVHPQAKIVKVGYH